MSLTLWDGLKNVEEYYGVLVVETVAQLERECDDTNIEDRLGIELFFEEVNKSDVFNYGILEHIGEQISSFKLLESTSESSYINIILKISFKERKEDPLRVIIGSICKSFTTLSVHFQRTFVQMLYRRFFSALMALAQIGIEELKKKIEEKKVKESLRTQEEDATSKINWREIEKRNGVPKNNDVLRYVAGFLVRSLRWKNCPDDIINSIEKKTEIGSSELPLKCENWINVINRGGLIRVEDSFFKIVIRMKQISDKYYSQSVEKIRHQNIKDNAREEILRDPDILEKWVKIAVTDIDLKWFKHMAETFLNTRGKVLVKDVLEQYQNDTKDALKAKKSLRKAIKEKSDAAASRIKETSPTRKDGGPNHKTKLTDKNKKSTEERESNPKFVIYNQSKESDQSQLSEIITSENCENSSKVPVIKSQCDISGQCSSPKKLLSNQCDNSPDLNNLSTNNIFSPGPCALDPKISIVSNYITKVPRRPLSTIKNPEVNVNLKVSPKVTSRMNTRNMTRLDKKLQGSTSLEAIMPTHLDFNTNKIRKSCRLTKKSIPELGIPKSKRKKAA